MVVRISLHGGLETLVDDADATLLRAFNIQKQKNKEGRYYACIRMSDGRRIALHRYLLNAGPDVEVDHRNSDGLDNRRHNLRTCSHAQNVRNSSKRAHSAQPFKGVRRSKNGWYARLRVDGLTIVSPVVNSAELAALIYDALSYQHHGDFSRRNDHNHSAEEYSDALEYAAFIREMKGIFWRDDIRKYQVSKERRGKRFYIGCFPTLPGALTASRTWREGELAQNRKLTLGA